jgi:hypothetical protein
MVPNEDLIRIIREDRSAPRRVAARKELEKRFIHRRMPKAWELGGVASLSERFLGAAMDRLEGQKTTSQALKDSATATARIVADQFRLNPIPYALTPLAEVALNKSFHTGRPIESVSAQARGVPFLQSNTWTNPQIEKLFKAGQFAVPEGAQLFGPAQAEALLRGYFNTVGAYTLMLMEATDEKGAHLPTSMKPVARRFYGDKALRHDRASREFWELTNQSLTYLKSRDTMGKQGDIISARRWDQQPEALKVQGLQQTYGKIRKERDFMRDSPYLETVQEFATRRLSPKDIGELQDNGKWNDIGALKLELNNQYSRIISDFARTSTREIKEVISAREKTQ